MKSHLSIGNLGVWAGSGAGWVFSFAIHPFSCQCIPNPDLERGARSSR
jgi:hypothetical protein